MTDRETPKLEPNIASLCDVALQDSLVGFGPDCHYDAEIFAEALAGNGYQVVPIDRSPASPRADGGGSDGTLSPRDERVPISIPHPAEFIREEMDARDWAIPTMARKMGGDFGINAFALQMYLSIGPTNPGLRLGGMSADIARAFGVSAQFIENMEAAWLRYHAANEVREATSVGEARTNPPLPKTINTEKEG